MTEVTTERTAATEENKKKRRKGAFFLKFGLTGVALLGIGAAATSAAWTDQAWFAGTASTASIELEASLASATGFVAADTQGTAVVIPAATFSQLVPGADKSVTVYLKNTSTVNVKVSQLTAAGTGDVFATGGATVTVTATPAIPATLAPNDVVPVVVNVKTPSTLADSFQNKTGVITLTYQATTDLS